MRKAISVAVAGVAVAAVAVGATAFVPAQAQAASTENVYVISKEVQKTTIDSGKSYYKYQYKYKYTSSGLIKSRKGKYTSSEGSQYTTKYSTVYSYGANGRFASCAYNDTGGGDSDAYMNRYYVCKLGFKLDGKGRVKTVKGLANIKYSGKGYPQKVSKSGWYNKFTWDGRGRVKSMKHWERGEGTTTIGYTYDSKGSVASCSWGDMEYKNTYKSGRLAKRSAPTEFGGTETVRYSYKKIKVPKKFVKQVKAQQKWIYLRSTAPWCAPLESMYK